MGLVEWIKGCVWNVFFWEDNWLNCGNIKHVRFENVNIDWNMKVAINNVVWNIDLLRRLVLQSVHVDIINVPISNDLFMED